MKKQKQTKNNCGGKKRGCIITMLPYCKLKKAA